MALNGEKMKASTMIAKLNEIGGKNGVGLLDIVENRMTGMKDRGVYETPGGTILYRAHEVLEMITIDKDTAHMKKKLSVDFADLVYNGKWFTPLREALQAFAVETQKHVTGQVKLKLYKATSSPPASPLPRPCTPRTSSPSRRATTTRPTPPASSTCGACPTLSWRCGTRGSSDLSKGDFGPPSTSPPHLVGTSCAPFGSALGETSRRSACSSSPHQKRSAPLAGARARHWWRRPGRLGQRILSGACPDKNDPISFFRLGERTGAAAPWPCGVDFRRDAWEQDITPDLIPI